MSKSTLLDILGRFCIDTENISGNSAEDIAALRQAIIRLVTMVADTLGE